MATVKEIGEFALIDRIARLVRSAPSVLEGIGDDCAVVRFGERLLLVSCDLSVENVHFIRAHATAEDIGWKAAASALSDIAAMGGAPLFCLVSLACPADTEVSLIERLYDGLLDAAAQCGATLVGGDTTRSQEGIVIDVTVLGEAIGNRYLSRKGARPGDVLAVTGALGLAAAGLRALERGEDARDVIRAHYHPVPRIVEGQWLSACAHVHASIDVSDGLTQDAGHLAAAACLGVDIDSARLPVAAALASYCQTRALDPCAFMLSGGEDYELAFAVDGEHYKSAIEAFRREFHTAIAVVGTFTDAWRGVRVNGQELSRTGFDHFK